MTQPNGCPMSVNTKFPSKNSYPESLQMNHMFDTQGRKQSLDKLLAGSSKKIWQQALSNELGRIAQGIRIVQGNDVLDFVPFATVPSDQIETYANMLYDLRPLKTEKFRVHLTVGGC